MLVECWSNRIQPVVHVNLKTERERADYVRSQIESLKKEGTLRSVSKVDVLGTSISITLSNGVEVRYSEPFICDYSYLVING